MTETRLKHLAKRILRVPLFPVLRYFGPRFHNILLRQDELVRQLGSLSARLEQSVGRLDSRLEDLIRSQDSRFHQMEQKLSAEVETMMEILETAQRAASRPPLPGARRAPWSVTGGVRGLGYCKVCNIEDFAHPDLVEVLRDIFPHEVKRLGEGFPIGFEFRKHWEVAMAVRSLADFGILHDRAEVLGVGAGNEPTIFYLTNFVHRVFATDLYVDPGIWKDFADPAMLTDPGRYWPGPWNPRRLVVQHMNALDLQYEDESFDAVFSSSSIEHFGDPDEVDQAMDEMFRVLRPGGILSLATEYRIEGDVMDLGKCLLFDADRITELLVGDRDWKLVSPLDTSISDQTLAQERPHEEFLADFFAHVQSQGALYYHELDIASFPQVLMRTGPAVWTSVHLALRKS